MTPAQFTRALAATRMLPGGKSTQAARLVLVDNLGHREAAARVGIDASAVTRAVHRLAPRECCPTCGQPVPA